MNDKKIPVWVWLIIPATIIIGIICFIRMCNKSCLETCREIDGKMKEIEDYEGSSQMFESNSFSGNGNN